MEVCIEEVSVSARGGEGRHGARCRRAEQRGVGDGGRSRAGSGPHSVAYLTSSSVIRALYISSLPRMCKAWASI